MKISIVGTGYVGLCSAVGFGLKGHDVVCIDIDTDKVDKINAGIAPIFEEGLEDGLKKLVSSGKLRATSHMRDILDTEVTFISVGTPCDDEGRIDLRYINKAAEEIGNALREKPVHFVVVKSTVVPGTTESVGKIIENHSEKRLGDGLHIAMNPEFLREGQALKDFLNPDRIVIGVNDAKMSAKLEEVYENFQAPKLVTTIKTAEMIKYASNAFLATKISFMNEIGNMCKSLGINVNEVARGMSYDERISPHFLESGVGFGGSCFPKDVMALLRKAEETGHEPEMLKSVISVNRKQPYKIVDILKNRIGSLGGKRIAVLGLAFKDGTDDVRESPAIKVINRLLQEGAHVVAYDPVAMKNMQSVINDIEYASSIHSCLADADACLLLTKWNEFRQLNDFDFNGMKTRVIIEGRNILDSKVSGHEGICW